MSDCLENLVENGSFEDSAPLPSSPINFSTGSTISGAWYDVNSSVDIMHNNQQDQRSPVAVAKQGSVWIGLRGEGGSNEAAAAPLNQPLVKGATYTLSFWAASNKPAKLTIYLVTTSSKLESDDLRRHDRLDIERVDNQQWSFFSRTFVAKKNYQQIALVNRSHKWSYVALDAIRLTRRVAGCCPDNLVPNGGFEGPGTYGGWKSIFGDGNFDNWVTDHDGVVADGDSGYDVFSSPVDNAPDEDGSSGHWAVLHSFRLQAIGVKRVNGAITIRLNRPMTAGVTYTVSFWGATRSRVVTFAVTQHSKVNMLVSTSTFFSPPDTEQASSGADANSDWQKEIAGTAIFHRFKLDGKPKTWHHYETKFLADAAYEYVLIQVVDGDHPAIDDVCISAAVQQRLAGGILGNRHKKEVHDLGNEQVLCQVSSIVDHGHDTYFDAIEDAHDNGYDDCAYCIGVSSER